MSDNATLIERLLNNRAPAIFEAARMAAARIAELEAEVVRLTEAELITEAVLAEREALAVWHDEQAVIAEGNIESRADVAGWRREMWAHRQSAAAIRARPAP